MPKRRELSTQYICRTFVVFPASIFPQAEAPQVKASAADLDSDMAAYWQAAGKGDAAKEEDVVAVEVEAPEAAAE